jgi:hypothetical protein
MPEYVGWEGLIPSGYGAGEVELKEYGVAQVLSSGKDKLTVATFPQGKEEVYTLIRMKGDDWLIMNRTGKTESKPEYRKSADITTRGRERLKTYPAVMGPTIAAGLGYGMGRKKDVISPLSAWVVRRKLRSRMPSIRLQRWARKHLTTKRIMSAAKWAPLAASIPVSAAIAEIVALRRSGMKKSASQDDFEIIGEYLAGYKDMRPVIASEQLEKLGVFYRGMGEAYADHVAKAGLAGGTWVTPTLGYARQYARTGASNIQERNTINRFPKGRHPVYKYRLQKLMKKGYPEWMIHNLPEFAKPRGAVIAINKPISVLRGMAQSGEALTRGFIPAKYIKVIERGYKPNYSAKDIARISELTPRQFRLLLKIREPKKAVQAIELLPDYAFKLKLSKKRALRRLITKRLQRLARR